MPNLADNRRARFDYDILETVEAGLVLSGQETKAVKKGQMSLKGAFVTFHNGEAWLTNAHISPYTHAGALPNYDPTRSRKLLLRKKEYHYLMDKAQAEGLTIVPLSVYTKHRLVKVTVALARGRKKYDKRDAIKKRDAQRELRRVVAN